VATFRIQQLKHLVHNLHPRGRPVSRLEEAADVTAQDGLLGSRCHRSPFASVRHRCMEMDLRR
jgi:hypothetical protein